MTRRTYYKATRPDGMDFYTGTVDYAAALASGEILRHPETRRRDQPATYFAVATVPTDCTGMKWPCRLFAVHGIGKPMTSSALPNKRAFSALRVVEELPSWQALGPQGQLVAAHIERARHLSADDCRQLAAAGSVARGAAWTTARTAALTAAGSVAGTATWTAARGAAWTTARTAALTAAWDAALTAVRTAVRDAALTAAQDATWAAIAALLVRDLITDEWFDSLTGPWRSVMGPTWEEVTS